MVVVVVIVAVECGGVTGGRFLRREWRQVKDDGMGVGGRSRGAGRCAVGKKKEERKSGEVDAARKGRAAGACVWSEAEAPEVEEGEAAV
jgi:hypothetical protein